MPHGHATGVGKDIVHAATLKGLGEDVGTLAGLGGPHSQRKVATEPPSLVLAW